MADARGQLIVMSGIDGCGKSSHLAWISAALTAKGQRHEYVRLRWSALTSAPVLGLAKLLGYSPRRINPRSQTMEVVHRHHEWALMHTLWPPLFTIDMMLAAQRRVLSQLRRGRWVVCDRYVLDALVDAAAILQDEALLDGFLSDKLLGLMPSNVRGLILDTDPQLAFERKPDVLEPRTLMIRRPMYLHLAERTGLPIVDGNRSFAAIQEEITNLIGITPLPEHRGILPGVVE